LQIGPRSTSERGGGGGDARRASAGGGGRARLIWLFCIMLHNTAGCGGRERERERSEGVDRRDCSVVMRRTTLLSTAGPALHAAGLLAYINVNVTATVASKSRATVVHGCRSKRPLPPPLLQLPRDKTIAVKLERCLRNLLTNSTSSL